MYEWTHEERSIIDAMYANEYVAVQFGSQLTKTERAENSKEYRRLSAEYDRLDIISKYGMRMMCMINKEK